MITYKTDLEEIPESCGKCALQWCNLPLKSKRSGYYLTDTIKKEYLNKRHKKCPLIEIDLEKERK